MQEERKLDYPLGSKRAGVSTFRRPPWQLSFGGKKMLNHEPVQMQISFDLAPKPLPYGLVGNYLILLLICIKMLLIAPLPLPSMAPSRPASCPKTRSHTTGASASTRHWALRREERERKWMR